MVKIKGELNPQIFALCGSGAGIVAFPRGVHWTNKRREIPVLLSRRAEKVGPGLGITSGGFAEIADIRKKEVGTIVETAEAAYRESYEENFGFMKVVSYTTFLERAQSISTIHVRVDDEANLVHACNFYALGLSSDEWGSVCKLPPGDERDGPLVVMFLSWNSDISRIEPETYISLRTYDGKEITRKDFYHKHELRAFGMIAWHAHHKRLWGSERGAQHLLHSEEYLDV